MSIDIPTGLIRSQDLSLELLMALLLQSEEAKRMEKRKMVSPWIWPSLKSTSVWMHKLLNILSWCLSLIRPLRPYNHPRRQCHCLRCGNSCSERLRNSAKFLILISGQDLRVSFRLTQWRFAKGTK